MKERTHTLPSFSAYLNKAFHLRDLVARLTDARHDPEISPQSIFLALFHSFAFRLPSLQQLEAELQHSFLPQWIGAERPFHDDTLRYSLCGFDLEPLEQMLVDINRRLKRSKALDPGRIQGHLVAALDGVEVLSSYSRRCDACLQRRVTVREGGHKVEQIQYYHRAVGCQIISSPVKPFLALEWLQPGEGEDTAALRLLARIPDLYGSRFFDILLLDALYTQAPVLELARQIGWELVISLKQNCPDLYQSAVRLFAARPPDSRFSEQQEGKTYEVQLWDTEGLPFFVDHPSPIRVVRSEEKLTRNRYREGELAPHTTEQEWMWATTLEASVFPAPQVRRLGHDRWKQENNGWMDLTQNWAFKHDFVHACRHRPQEIGPAGDRQPVPNRGLAAVSLILLVAFALCSAFTLRHSKLVRRYGLTTVAVARQLYRYVSKAPPPIRAPN
jgi:hypothetical protein